MSEYSKSIKTFHGFKVYQLVRNGAITKEIPLSRAFDVRSAAEDFIVLAKKSPEYETSELFIKELVRER